MTRQTRKVSVAEAESRRQERQCQARQQAAKTLKLLREERGNEFYTRQIAARQGRRLGSKVGVP